MVAAQDVNGSFAVLGQVREGDQSNRTEAPVNLYGKLGVDRFLHGSEIDSYFRLERDVAGHDDATELYAASARGTVSGVEAKLGRQFISEVPGGAFVADAGRLRFSPGSWPVALSVFGGQPRFYEPTYGSEKVSQDEQIVGASMRTTAFRDGTFSVGFLQHQRDQRTLRQLLSLTGNQVLAHVVGTPSLYGTASLDAKTQNFDFANLGAQVFLRQARLSANFETTYYKPQDQGERLTADPARREDPIFELFSLSQMLRFRGGLRQALSATISAYADYSYQRYERQDASFVNGHLGDVGVTWLPGGDGLERVRVEYYSLEGSLGHVDGGRFLYDNFVYERIVLRTKVDIAAYSKRSNRSATAVGTRVGLGYELAPGLLAEISLEGNRNARFADDLRVGFYVSYDFRYRKGAPLEHGDAMQQVLPGGQPS